MSIDLTFRCTTRAAWITAAKGRGIYGADQTDLQGKTINVVNPDFMVDEIGFPALVPAVIDAQGNVATPAVMDTWYWINFRISGVEAESDHTTLYAGETDTSWNFTQSKLVAFIRASSTPQTVTLNGTTIKTYEFAVGADKVQLLDSRDYAPVNMREWSGGMSF